MELNDSSETVDLGIGRSVPRPNNVYSLRGLLRSAYANSGTTMTDVAERTGLSRSAVASVLGHETAAFPYRELFMAIARDLVDEPYLGEWSACWQAAHDSPNRDVHPPV
ncbi:winged helix-turn-helix domain-containing protein [Nocardia sp. NPDC047038]|uniref:winged helix-turn-helix domain-containing protein n=1 Tax=Nocardia sp. NPDC047038 TaxID=3154338 RepID=UPI0033EF681A